MYFKEEFNKNEGHIHKSNDRKIGWRIRLTRNGGLYRLLGTSFSLSLVLTCPHSESGFISSPLKRRKIIYKEWKKETNLPLRISCPRNSVPKGPNCP